MLKKISVQDIRLGMFIEKLCGSWMDHPFWKKAFMLNSEKDLQALKACGIDELWIDLSKGLDVESKHPPVVTEEKVANTLSEEVKGDKKQDQVGDVSSSEVESDKKQERVPLHEEIQRAQKLHAKAKRAAAFVFREARMGNVPQLAEAVVLVDEVIQSVSRNPGALISLSRLRNKDDHTYLHSVAVSALMIALGRQMDMEGGTLKSLGMAGLLHDVGKVMIPDNILSKPGKLTDAEFDVVKAHSRRGWEIIKSDPNVDDIVRDVCLHHHERMDGSGYPDKLSGESLSLSGAVVTVHLTIPICYSGGLPSAKKESSRVVSSQAV